MGYWYFGIVTVWTAIFFGSLLAVSLGWLFSRTKILIKIGPKIGIIALSSVIIRILIPIEFQYTYEVPIYKGLTELYDFLNYRIPFYEEVSIAGILLIIWLFGFVVIFMKRIVDLLKMIQIKNTLSRLLGQEMEIYNPLFKEKRIIKVAVVSQCKSPFLIGIFKPIVVLPKKEWKIDELKYVLLHEYYHYYNHDIVKKMIVEICCDFLWWNPAFGYVKKQIFHLIEVHNDYVITRNMSRDERILYMEYLVKSAYDMNKVAFIADFSRTNTKKLKQRLELIANTSRKKTRGYIIIAALILFGVFATTGVVFDVNFSEPKDSGTTIDESNAYLIDNGNEYEVYVRMEGENQYTYFFSDTNRQNFSKHMKVFTQNNKKEIEEYVKEMLETE